MDKRNFLFFGIFNLKNKDYMSTKAKKIFISSVLST